MATYAALAYILYDDPIWGTGGGFPWRLLMLPGVYYSLFHAAMGYLTLFVPRAPFAAWEALMTVGFKWTGILPCSSVALLW